MPKAFSGASLSKPREGSPDVRIDRSHLRGKTASYLEPMPESATAGGWVLVLAITGEAGFPEGGVPSTI